MQDDFLGLSTSEWTALGTILLFVVTAIYVILTGKLAGKAERSASAAEDSAKAAQRAASASEQSHVLAAMPVLVAKRDNENGRPFVTVTNVSSQPAINVDLQVAGPVAGVQDHQRHQLMMVEPGATVRFEPPHHLEDKDLDDWSRPASLAVEYQDSFGKWYRTERRQSIVMGQSYDDAFLIYRRSGGSWTLQTPDKY